MVTAFLSNNIVKIITIAFLLGIVGFFIFDYQTVKNDLTRKRAEILIMNDKIQTQNEAIKALEIDVETYKNKKPQIIEKIVTKYQDIVVKDETCESQLEAIYESQRLFFNSINKGNNSPFEKAKSKDITQ